MRQRLGMMLLLGQHGHPQDYQTGLEYIHLAAESCDENAPQGAFVSFLRPLFSTPPKGTYV